MAAMNTTPVPMTGRNCAILAALTMSLAGCGATVQKVPLLPPAAEPASAGVQVIDSRPSPDVKVDMERAVGGGGPVIITTEPSVTEALRSWVAAGYKGPQPFYVGLERLEVRHKQGLATADEFTCAIDSQVRAGGETGRPVRSTLRSTPTGDAIGVGVFLSQCLEAHARDINNTAASGR